MEVRLLQCDDCKSVYPLEELGRSVTRIRLFDHRGVNNSYELRACNFYRQVDLCYLCKGSLDPEKLSKRQQKALSQGKYSHMGKII